MGKLIEGIDAKLARFIEAQRMFFVATAPSGPDGHVNLSPKGLNTLRIVDERRVAYLDLTGSGIETIAHLRENGRITIMLCAFEGRPRIVRLQGHGTVIEPGDPAFGDWRSRFGEHDGVRSVIVITLDRISDSCGYGVPLLSYEGERPQMAAWVEHKGPAGIEAYQAEHNVSVDGLPGLRWASGKD
jgi:hypothetical protein